MASSEDCFVSLTITERPGFANKVFGDWSERKQLVQIHSPSLLLLLGDEKRNSCVVSILLDFYKTRQRELVDTSFPTGKCSSVGSSQRTGPGVWLTQAPQHLEPKCHRGPTQPHPSPRTCPQLTHCLCQEPDTRKWRTRIQGNASRMTQRGECFPRKVISGYSDVEPRNISEEKD